MYQFLIIAYLFTFHLNVFFFVFVLFLETIKDAIHGDDDHHDIDDHDQDHSEEADDHHDESDDHDDDDDRLIKRKVCITNIFKHF